MRDMCSKPESEWAVTYDLTIGVRIFCTHFLVSSTLEQLRDAAFQSTVGGRCALAL